ncbi:MAG TPA: LPXTG cell wall anchor domain-containing protein, partial [Acidimicrobiia bacterium]
MSQVFLANLGADARHVPICLLLSGAMTTGSPIWDGIIIGVAVTVLVGFAGYLLRNRRRVRNERLP